jgi:hypothetical protein
MHRIDIFTLHVNTLDVPTIYYSNFNIGDSRVLVDQYNDFLIVQAFQSFKSARVLLILYGGVCSSSRVCGGVCDGVYCIV